MKKVSYTLNRVLVIDDVPVIAFGLLETFTALNKQVSIDYESSVFSALSSAAHTDKTFDLLVIGLLPGHDAEVRSVLQRQVCNAPAAFRQ